MANVIIMTDSPLLQYINQQLHFESASLTAIANQYGTPCYVYSEQAMLRQWQAFTQTLADRRYRICYAVKANSNLAILNILAKLGAGFDIVSQGELERVLIAKGNPENIVFSGVGKQAPEIQRALEVGIYCFNVESAAELDVIQKIAKMYGKTARIALRINPDIDSKTHPYIATGLKENKFGIPLDEALSLYHASLKLTHLKVIGIACHIGSQITQLDPFQSALRRLLGIYEHFKKIGPALSFINIGGGLGVSYHDEKPPSIQQYLNTLLHDLPPHIPEILFEPGRSIVAEAGLLLTRVIYTKTSADKNFAIVDSAMNDFIRPALYDAWHEIKTVQQSQDEQFRKYDIVGPICESGDYLGKNRELALAEGDLLVVEKVGAYGTSMASNYNSRCRPAEVLVKQGRTYLIREREDYSDLWVKEKMLPQ